MKIRSEFSKYANRYQNVNIIQRKVVQKLLELTKVKPKKILDLGCGSGELYKELSWDFEKYIGLDFAPGMLELHPKSDKITLIEGNFNDKKTFELLAQEDFEYIFSSSALQWADDLAEVFSNIALFNRGVSLAIFTSNTFKTLNETAAVNSLLLSKEKIATLQENYFNADFESMNYKLEFESVREMFQYIKQSGVSGSRNLLSFKETKELMQNYPLTYLEFEVVFITSR